MILPTPRTDRGRQQSISAVGALLLMVGFYAAMAAAPLPSYKSSNALVRSLDPLFVERFATPPPPDVPRAAPKAEESRTETPVVAAIEQEVGTALGELTRRFSAATTLPPATIGQVRVGAERETGLTAPGSVGEEGRFAELFGGGDALPPPSARVRTRTESEGSRRGALESGTRIRVADSLGSGPITPHAAAPASRVEASAERARRAATAPDVVIREYEPERFNTVAVDRLATWLRANPRELPVGVRVHLNHQPSFLTAAVPFVAGGRTLELYLMYNPSLRELHVVLVDGQRSAYLVDRGFQAQSRSLREGTVRRLNGEIVAVNSQAAAAGSDRAREFYNIFLSWWDVARTNVGR